MSCLFLDFFFFHLIPGPAASPSRRVLFDWYDKVLGFSRGLFDWYDKVLGFWIVRLRHGSEPFFFFAYRR